MSMVIITPTAMTDAMLVSSTVPETDYAAWSATTIYAAGDNCIVVVDTHLKYEALLGKKSVVTMTIAAPCVVTWTDHGLAADTPIVFTTTGALPTGLTAGTTYYVKTVGANSFQVVTTVGGATGITTSGTQSGVHTCGLAANYNKPPATNPSVWLDLGATNRWAMLDNKVGTVTTVATPLTLVVNPGRVGGVALLEMVGETATITLKDGPGGNTVYTNTKTLDGTIITSFYEWFFEDYVQLTDWAVADLPAHYTAPELTISITSASGYVACGVCKFGLTADIGLAQYGATVGIIDYSKKEADQWGNYTITERAYSKRNNLKLWTKKVDFNRIYKKLAALRATPAIYIGVEDDGYEPLLVYGFYRNFSIDVAYVNDHLCDLEIEGLI